MRSAFATVGSVYDVARDRDVALLVASFAYCVEREESLVGAVVDAVLVVAVFAGLVAPFLPLYYAARW